MKNLNIPVTDLDCWEKYPKFNWVYETTKLLDAQNVKWKPEPTGDFIYSLDCITVGRDIVVPDTLPENNNIYVKQPIAKTFLDTEVGIQKGEVKWLQHHINGDFVEDIYGEIDLRINAFVLLHLHKFNGIISIRTIDHNIYQIKLNPNKLITHKYPQEANILANKLYKQK